MGEVFISYKQEERERMRPIADGLRELGVDVWFDERLQPDRSFTEEIQHLIQSCKAQLVCWSPAAIGSEWVRGEAEKGRQRGVLVAAMIEPCDLPPPFNMHHAESLVGWSGDARHLGWRKIVDAIGRKLDRPGLGELAALQVSTDSAAWKKWAQKYSSDPSADEAWAKAEELEIGAARERMARERETAKRAAEEAERRRAAAAPAPPTRAPPPSPQPTQRRGVTPLVLGLGFVGVAAAAALFLFSQRAPNPAPGPGETAVEQAQAPQNNEAMAAQERRIAELESELQSLRAQPAPEAQPEQQQRVRQLETQLADARNARAEAPAQESRPQQIAAPDPAAAALSAPNQISARDWSVVEGQTLARRILAATPLNSLRAAAAHDARAQTVLALAHDHGLSGVSEDDAEAVRLYRLAANQGFARGQTNLGSMYREGRGVTQDDAEAVRLHRLAANQGNARGQINLGRMYETGQGVAQDDAEAVRLYRQAANQGQAIGQSNLGNMYREGRGVTQDDAEAVRLYRLAANQGDASAQTNLGFMYENGRGGLTADRAEAVRLYRLAARQGNTTAQQNLRVLGESW